MEMFILKGERCQATLLGGFPRSLNVWHLILHTQSTHMATLPLQKIATRLQVYSA